MTADVVTGSPDPRSIEPKASMARVRSRGEPMGSALGGDEPPDAARRELPLEALDVVRVLHDTAERFRHQLLVEVVGALEQAGYRVTRVDVGRDIAEVLAKLKPVHEARDLP